jgi:PPP family 3-phenylpropionic acid transporter
VKALRFVYLALGAATACVNPFVAVILQQRGLAPEAIGAVNAIGACGLIVAIAAWGHIGDRVLGRRKAVQVCSAMAVVVAAGIAAPTAGIALAALVVAFNGTQGALLALADSVAVNTLADPQRGYGRIRLLASLSFAVTIVAAGFIYDGLGYSSAGLLYALFAIILIGGMAATSEERPRAGHLPPDPAERQTPASVRGGRRIGLGSTGAAFAVQPRLLPVLATVAVAWFAVIVSFTFLSLRIVELGGGASDVALSFGVSAFAEIPGMLLASSLAARLGLRGLFFASACLFGIAFMSWSVLDTPLEIVATRVLTGFAYGGMTVAMVLTMGEILPARLQATGQALYQAAATGIGSVAGNLVGGLVYGSVGPAVLFVICAAMLFAGSGLALLALPGRTPHGPIDAVEEATLPTAPIA